MCIRDRCINDELSTTLAAVSSNETEFKDCLPNISGSEKIGSGFAVKLTNAGIKTVVFDRAGRKYHGCVKAFAEALRSSGLEF